MAIELSKNSTNFSPIGRKSRVVELSIHNNEDPKTPYKVYVQANKHHGICNIILCKEVTKEVTYEYTGPDGKKRTRKKQKSHLIPVRRLSEVISDFQGRQYDDSENMNQLTSVLTEILNSKQENA